MPLIKGASRKRKPGVRFGKGVERPHVWICGEDPYKHQMYLPWLKAKAQADFRGEEWLLTFEDYFTVWNGKWEERGRDSDQLCMTRIDWTGAWSIDNVYTCTRKEHCGRQGLARRGEVRKKRTRGMDIHKRKTAEK